MVQLLGPRESDRESVCERERERTRERERKRESLSDLQRKEGMCVGAHMSARK